MKINESHQTILRNCTFKFRCSQAWNSLATTGQDDVRYCKDCEKNVYLVRSLSDLYEFIKSDFCVAIPFDVEDDFHEGNGNEMIGLITSINIK